MSKNDNERQNDSAESQAKMELVNHIGGWTCRIIVLGALIWAFATGHEGTALLCILILVFWLD